VTSNDTSTGTSSRADAEIGPRMRALAQPLVSRAGLDLIDLEIRGGTGSRVVRVVVDADAGVDLDTCADVSRALSEALDAEEFIPGTYVLEVTSPGVDRPLRTHRDFARNIGRNVRIWRTPAAIEAGGKGEADGELLEVTDHVIRLEIAGDEQVVPWDQIDRGKVLLPW